MGKIKKIEWLFLFGLFIVTQTAFAVSTVSDKPTPPQGSSASDLTARSDAVVALTDAKNITENFKTSSPKALISTVRYTYYRNGAIWTRTEYDASGHKITYAYFLPDGKKKLYEEYNPLTRKIVLREVYTQGVLRERHVYNPNGNGRTISLAYFNSNGIPTLYYEWDSATGRLVCRALYYRDGLIKTRFTYNRLSGALVSREEYAYLNLPGGVWKEVTTFTAQGQKIKTDRYLSLNGPLEETTGYNPINGQVIYTQWYSLSGSLSRKIDYDSSGNASQMTVYDANGNVAQTFSSSYLDNSNGPVQWLLQDQQQHTSGLVVSYPQDPGVINNGGTLIYANTQCYTYDQAIAGITLLKQGDVADAAKIFSFYFTQWQLDTAGHGGVFTGFWTDYNANSWTKIEWRKGMGENAWIGIFCLQYQAAVSDDAEKANALQLATDIAKWIGTLPSTNGAVAMGPINTGSPNYGALISVENELDYYSLLKALKDKASDTADQQLFSARWSDLKNWLKNQAYDAASGLFKKGGSFDAGTGQITWELLNGNLAKSLDVNSWAVSAIGVSSLVNDFGINIDNFMNKIGQTFAVQQDGTFGGDIFQAKGFDFADAANASMAYRSGIKWIEGTNQMILAYKMVAAYFSGTDSVRASYYSALADTFSSRNPENATLTGNALGYHYADHDGAQIYAGIGNWRTAFGQATSSAVWAYFSSSSLNPFQIN